MTPLRHANAIKRFCDEHNLVGLKVRKNRLLSVLRSNIDLGAILFSESYGGSLEESAEIAIKINTVRPELPIIIRRDSSPHWTACRRACAGSCAPPTSRDDTAPLRKVIDEYIFSLDYPNALVRGISEITQSMLAACSRMSALAGTRPASCGTASSSAKCSA